MKYKIDGKPSFAYITVELNPGEEFISEADAMASMDAGIEIKPKFNGGFFKGLMRKIFGGETLFVSHYKNASDQPARLVITQPTPGDVLKIDLKENGEKFIQPGAYLCSTPGVEIKLKWAGFRSFIAREGLFRLLVAGTGQVWIGAYGHIYEKEIDGDYLIDTSHLVAYDPAMQMRLQMSGGLISSFTGGEGLLTRMSGKGTILLQSRSMGGLVSFLNPRI